MKILSVLLTYLMLLWGAASVYAESLLIKDANVFTGDDAPAVRQDILIVDGRIESLGADLADSETQTVIDAAGRPVTPAFFAGLTAAGLSEIGMVYEAVDNRLSGLYTGLIHPEFDVRQAYNPHSSVVPITRIEGYGYTLLMAGPGDRTISGRGSLVRLDGGYESFEGDDVLFVNVDGYSGNRLGSSRAAHWMLLESVFAELSTDDDDLTLITPRGKDTLQAVRRNGLFIFRANRASDIVQAMAFGEAHKLRIVISGGQEAWMVRDALADADVPVVINALDNLPGSFDGLGARLDNAALLHEAGVTVLFTSGETHNARKLRQVAGNAVANGLPHGAAIEAMTSLPAEIFGGTPRMIAPGLAADLVIWSGDPLEVTSAADHVILSGDQDPMRSRQTELLHRYLPKDAGMGRAYIKP